MARYGTWVLGLVLAATACSSESSSPSHETTGGAVGTGGVGTGGVVTGGAATGGTGLGGLGGTTTGGATSGGASPTGGETATGGVATGGETATGGLATGGATATGGAVTGGAVTGGAATGGVATGGVAATGGAGGVPSTGCGVTGAATGVQNLTIDVGGTARTYVLSVPTGYTGDAPLALVFAWHGLGGDGALARMYFGVEARSGGQAIFVYPDALPNGDGDTAWDLGASGVDIALFDTLLSTLSAEYCIDASRVFSTGHSYGGFMTNLLGCVRADVLRAVAPVAGGPPFGGPVTCEPAVAAWIAHGDNDATVNISMGQTARDNYLAANTCGTTTAAVTPSPCVAYDGCVSGRPVHWCVHQDGHNWPSFAAQGIWDFFAQY